MENIENIETKEQVVAQAIALVEVETIPEKTDMDQLKQLFYRYHNQEMQDAYKAYIEGGGAPEEYVPQMDPRE